MQIVILAAFVLVLSLDLAPSLEASPRVVAAAVGGYILLAAVLAKVSTLVSLRMMRGGLGRPPWARKITHVLQMLLQVYLVAGLGGLMLLGFGHCVAGGMASISLMRPNVTLANVPLLERIILLSPFMAALLLNWALGYPIHREMRRSSSARGLADGPWRPPIWSLGEYVSYNLRHQFLFIAVPVGLIIFLKESLWMYGWPALKALHIPGVTDDSVEAGLSLLLTGVVFLIAPMIIVRLWQTRSLEDGPLREELAATLRRLRLRCRDIRVWQTGGVIANAGVMGVVGPVRYVLLTDALLENMDRRHLQAIFAHEVGHITSHHIFYSAVFAVGTVLLSAVTAQGVLAAAIAYWPPAKGPLGAWGSQAFALALLGAIWVVFFSRLSRQFERQSDVIGAWAVGAEHNTSGDPTRITPEGAAIFATALGRVAELNGIPANQPNWRHGTIEQRISYIIWLGSTGGSRRTIDTTVKWIKLGLWALLAVTILAAVAQELWM